MQQDIDLLTFHQLAGCDTGVGILASLYTFTQSMAPHQHDFWELAFAVKGSGHHEDERARLPLLSGDVWVILPGQWHAYPLVKGSLSIFNLLLARDFILAHASALQDIRCLGPLPQPTTSPTWPVQHLRLSPGGLEHICTLLVTLENELATPHRSAHAGFCIGLVLQILALLDRYSTSDINWNARMLAARDDPGLFVAVRLIEEHYTETLTVEDIARQSGYTPAYLARKFRQHIGVPPIDYLLHVRIQHACSLLQSTDWPVTTVAHQVGFSDSRYFATRFRREVGMTPSQFRNPAHEQNLTHRG